MPIVFAAIAPHGFSIIPEMSDDADGGLRTREAMFELGRRFAAARPDAIVIAGPHGFRVDGSICVANVTRGAGTLVWNNRQVEQNVPIDRALTASILQLASDRRLPVASGGYAGNAAGVIPLDWGIITPLYFLGFPRNMIGHGHVLADPPAEESGPPVVIVTPSRFVARDDLVRFGELIADAAAQDGRRIAYVASCDWAHTHRADGPYGFHETAARVDRAVVEAVAEADVHALLAIDPDDAANAAIDGLPQALLLAGVIDRTGLRGELLSYEAPTYFGMLVAAYEQPGP